MKTFASILALSIGFTFVASPAGAGEGPAGHSHGAPAAESKGSEAKMTETATAEVKRLVEAGKLDSAWGSATAQKASQAGKAKDWVVQFGSDQVKDPSKKNLFVILSKDGAIKAVNFKGMQKMHAHGDGAAHAH